MATSSTEFFCNIKSIPDPTSREYNAFFENEIYKMENGVTVNGVWYSPWLYFHLNHWKILLDAKPKPGQSKAKRVLANPTLRDNEWIIAEHIQLAEKKKKGLLVIGTRRFAKTEIGASYIGHSSLVNFGSENMVAASNDADINKIISSLKRGYKHLHPAIRPIYLADQWGAGKDVELGFKESDGTRHEFSKLLMRNHNGGKNTEAGAGSTLSAFLLDEIGKSDWMDFFDAVKPAFESEYGWRVSPFCTGTTGNMDKARELEGVYAAMEDYNFITVKIDDPRGKQFSFFPGMMSLKFPKKTISMNEFLGKNVTDPGHTIRVTNWERAEEALKAIFKAKEDKGQFSSARKEKMYYPTKEDEMFLTNASDNPFADCVEHAKEHLKYLNSLPQYEEFVFFTRDAAGKVKPVHTTNRPIVNFPALPNEDRDCPVIIYDHPLPGQEFGLLHVGGMDPYNQDESWYSPSLGTLYIFRRTYDPLNGRFQNTIVASYTARPQNIKKWWEQARLLMEYYQAQVLTENEDKGFIRYMDDLNLGFWLEDGLDLAREINPKTKVNRNKGLAATTPNIIFGNGIARNYFLEELIVGQDKDGQPIRKPGIIRIKDKGLLMEIIGYRPSKNKNDPRTNVDRIVAFRHCLMMAQFKNKYFPIAALKPPPPETRPKRRPVRSPFTNFSGRSFGGGGAKRRGPF